MRHSSHTGHAGVWCLSRVSLLIGGITLFLWL